MTIPTVRPPDREATDAVVAREVKRSFGDVRAVTGIDLDAPVGEVTALVGPNGAGKTTLMLVLATLLVPDSGTVRVAGHDPISEPDAVRERMGWAPDVVGLYDSLTCREYLEFFAAAYRFGRAQARARAGELLEQGRLSDLADRPVHVLSRGQKQRLGLARALVHSPQVLILDEPASGLDPRSRVELRDQLRGLARSGTAIIVSSHLLADLEEVADRVVFVDHGRTVGQHRLDALPTATATRTWRLRALNPDRLLSALTGFEHGEASAAGVDVVLGSEEEAADLVARLVKDKVRLVGVQPLGGALEATYLALTEAEDKGGKSGGPA